MADHILGADILGVRGNKSNSEEKERKEIRKRKRERHQQHGQERTPSGAASIQPSLTNRFESYLQMTRQDAEREAAARELSQSTYLPHSDTSVIFVNGPVGTVDSKLVHDTFSAFGNILSCKVSTYSSETAGFACVFYEKIEAAQKAFHQGVDGMLLGDELVYVELYMPDC